MQFVQVKKSPSTIDWNEAAAAAAEATTTTTTVTKGIEQKNRRQRACANRGAHTHSKEFNDKGQRSIYTSIYMSRLRNESKLHKWQC